MTAMLSFALIVLAAAMLCGVMAYITRPKALAPRRRRRRRPKVTHRRFQ